MAPVQGIICDWKLSDVDPKDIQSQTHSLIQDLKAKYDRVGAIKAEEVNYENTIKVRKFLTINQP